MAKILIIDDNIDICQLLERFFKKKGHDTKFFTSEVNALDYLKSNECDLVFCDFRLPKMDGKEVLEKIKQIDPSIQVVIITGYSDVKTAVDVIKLGAFDYVTKPLFPDEILITMEKALKHKASLGQEQEDGASIKDKPLVNVNHKNGSVNHPPSKHIIIGKSAEAKNIQKQIELVAPTNYSVIIYGESGTGKESIAYSIHALSNRKDKPFVAVDCGSLYKELAGSELFGHEKGAFTGAMQSKVGQFELANGGTIFLDEIANLSYDIQVSLLRVIQERKIRRLGSQKETPIDVRIIVASNEKINGATSKGTFREDLYHRFNEFSIDLPSLRDRKNDIMMFAEFFLSNANAELGKQIEGFDEEVEAIFLDYNWPGNLRELNNVIKRAVLLSGKNKITAETLPQEIVFQSKFSLVDDKSESKPLNGDAHNLKSIALNAEFEKIVEVLKKVNFNKSKAAQLLNIDRKTLYNKMKIFNLLNT
ncbi:MAG: response regulator with CheY-like receiver, AAA-type ATPase, and DNA-binding domain [Chitinophagaceae bacterium]|nr:response regulator with CheY-like receiver, AAA-type ATPase, and DNA-binding domain [Chitinophagaceae bacterium]